MQLRRTLTGLAALAAVVAGTVGLAGNSQAAVPAPASEKISVAATALQHGVAVRPVGSDSYWPPVGTSVAWTLTQPIQDLVDQGEAAGFPNLGTIGNTAHLQKHGDHTPWSAGKERGRIYAKDTQMPADFEAWLVAKCKSSYNTLWIDFFNINNKQYDNAGNYLGYSADAHLHISVRKGYEDTHVSLFKDYADSHGSASTQVTAWAQANVRSCAKLSCGAVGQVETNQTYPAACYTVGDTVTAEGVTNDKWVKVTLPAGTTGYVSGIYLKGSETGGVTKAC